MIIILRLFLWYCKFTSFIPLPILRLCALSWWPCDILFLAHVGHKMPVRGLRNLPEWQSGDYCGCGRWTLERVNGW